MRVDCVHRRVWWKWLSYKHWTPRLDVVTAMESKGFVLSYKRIAQLQTKMHPTLNDSRFGFCVIQYILLCAQTGYFIEQGTLNTTTATGAIAETKPRNPEEPETFHHQPCVTA